MSRSMKTLIVVLLVTAMLLSGLFLPNLVECLTAGSSGNMETVEVEPLNFESGSSSAEVRRVNINTASVEELMEIPGIGESKAKKIIEYREKNGKFESIEDIMNVSGIKENSFRKMQDYITV